MKTGNHHPDTGENCVGNSNQTRKTNLHDVDSGSHCPDAKLIEPVTCTSRMLIKSIGVFNGTNLLKNRLNYKATYKRLTKAGNHGIMAAQFDMETNTFT